MGSGMGSQASMPLTEAESGSSVLDWTDGTRHVAVTEAVRRQIVATVLSHVGPNLCPGLPFIRSTRGSSYKDRRLTEAGWTLARPEPYAYTSTCSSFVVSKERERDS